VRVLDAGPGVACVRDHPPRPPTGNQVDGHVRPLPMAPLPPELPVALKPAAAPVPTPILAHRSGSSLEDGAELLALGHARTPMPMVALQSVENVRFISRARGVLRRVVCETVRKEMDENRLGISGDGRADNSGNLGRLQQSPWPISSTIIALPETRPPSGLFTDPSLVPRVVAYHAPNLVLRVLGTHLPEAL